MISFHPTWQALGIKSGDPIVDATDQWEIAPADKRYLIPAIFLPDQLDRIRGTAFHPVEEVVSHFKGGYELHEGPSIGYRVRHVDLVDGVLYSANGDRHLRQRKRRLPAYVVPREVASGVLYESWFGNRWIYSWFADDCPRYLLAEQYGTPVTSATRPQGQHIPAYEALLGMRPQRFNRVHFDELILLEDFNRGRERQARFGRVRQKLLAAAGPHADHPGVFLLRGKTGDARFLANEIEIAERLARERGLRVLDGTKMSVDELIAACAGARVVAGVEGSQLAHGVAVMAPGTLLFTIQPPTRVTSAMKMFTDREEMLYAFVIGEGDLGAFTVEWDEVIRTLDMAIESSVRIPNLAAAPTA